MSAVDNHLDLPCPCGECYTTRLVLCISTEGVFLIVFCSEILQACLSLDGFYVEHSSKISLIHISWVVPNF